MRFAHLFLCAVGTAGVISATVVHSRAQLSVDTATILISHLERPIGREAYEMHSDGGDLVISDDLDLVDRGVPLRVNSSYRLAPDFTPSRFRVTGKTYRFVNVDTDVAVRGAGYFRQLRACGVTVRKTIDTLIATRCILEGWPLLFSDRDFEPFVQHCGLKSAMDL